MLSKIGIQITAAVSSLIVLITVGTVVFRFLEEWTWVQSFYFSVVTLSTVGYGDLHPTSDASRLFTAFYILVGVAVVLSSLGVIGTTHLRRRENRIESRILRRRGGKSHSIASNLGIKSHVICQSHK